MSISTDPLAQPAAAASADGAVVEPGAQQIEALIDAVGRLDCDAADAGLIGRISALERLKNAAAAAQARLTHTFEVQHTAAALAGITDDKSRAYRAERVRGSIARQIALARHQSPWHGQRLLALATKLCTDLPHTYAALAAGQTCEQRALSVHTQFKCLSAPHRLQADASIGPQLPHLGNQATDNTARSIAAKLDPAAALGKVRGAVADRHVSLRPAPDTMTKLSALLPVVQGVALYAALQKAAATLGGTGAARQRSRGQIMADELVSRVTGLSINGCDDYGVPTYAPSNKGDETDVAAAGEETKDSVPTEHAGTDDTEAADVDAGVAGDVGEDLDAEVDVAVDEDLIPAEQGSTTDATSTSAPTAAGAGGIQLRIVMTDRALFGADDQPAHLHGYGPIPAAIARSLLARQADQHTNIWIKRLYTDPTGKQLLATDSKARLFPAGIADFILTRDQICRTPWCDAPIRHIDHIHPHTTGGPTNIGNAEGLCQACNLAKDTEQWHHNPDNNDAITTTTPTGHTYTSHPPQPPQSARRTEQRTLPPGWAEIFIPGEFRYLRIA